MTSGEQHWDRDGRVGRLLALRSSVQKPWKRLKQNKLAMQQEKKAETEETKHALIPLNH